MAQRTGWHGHLASRSRHGQDGHGTKHVWTGICASVPRAGMARMAYGIKYVALGHLARVAGMGQDGLDQRHVWDGLSILLRL